MSCETETSPTFASTSEARERPFQSRWTLAFFDRELEREYLIERARRSVNQLRVVVTGLLLMSTVFIGTFFGLGWWNEGYVEGLGAIPSAAAVGMVLSLAVFVAFMVLIGRPRFWPHLQPITAVSALIWFGVDLPSLANLELPYVLTLTLSALIVVYGILRLRFIYASVLGGLVVGSHLAIAAATHHLAGATMNQFVTNALLSVAMNVIMMVAAYQFEGSERAAFWRHRQLRRREAALREALEELTRAESKLLDTEREAAQSRLVAGLLHEINNPTAVLRSNLQLWDRIQQKIRTAEASGDADAIRLLLDQSRPVGQAVGASARRVTKALKGLETFVGLDAGSRVRVDVVDGVREAARMVQVQRGASVEVEAPSDPVEIHAHRYRLNQVWLQLLDNAAKAVGPSGRVAARVEVDDGAIEVEVRDDGPGMDARQLASAFQVGFTDSEGHVKFHLGLPMSLRVVEEHGGRLDLDSAPGRGTTARVRLPRA